jgi:hypothetical protein
MESNLYSYVHSINGEEWHRIAPNVISGARLNPG